MTHLQSAYAQAIALHQELEGQLGTTAEQKALLNQADDLVRAIGRQLSAD